VGTLKGSMQLEQKLCQCLLIGTAHNGTHAIMKRDFVSKRGAELRNSGAVHANMQLILNRVAKSGAHTVHAHTLHALGALEDAVVSQAPGPQAKAHEASMPVMAH
jgi:hypothetical protein